MFTEALFIKAKCQKQPKCPLLSEWIKKLSKFTQWNTTQQKEGTRTFCDSMDGTGEHYVK